MGCERLGKVGNTLCGIGFASGLLWIEIVLFRELRQGPPAPLWDEIYLMVVSQMAATFIASLFAIPGALLAAFGRWLKS